MQRLNHWEISPELKRRKKVTVTNKTDLPDQVKNSFTDGEYRTVVTNEPVTVYRAFDGDAASQGAFATTSPAKSRIDVKIDLALKPEWKNTRIHETKIKIPGGEILNVGKVAPQTIDKTGTVLSGGGDQILMPRDWPSEWIQDIYKVPIK